MLAGLLALVFVSAPIMGCSVFNKEDDYVPEDPADKLYNEGLYLLNKKQDYEAAAKKFDEVDRQNPYSDWARKVLLMSAFSYYQAQKYDDCINAAKRYVTLHPGNPDAAYAQYLIGASYYDQIPDVNHDERGRTRPSARWRKWCANIRKRSTPETPRKKSTWRATSSPAMRWRSGVSI